MKKLIDLIRLTGQTPRFLQTTDGQLILATKGKLVVTPEQLRQFFPANFSQREDYRAFVAATSNVGRVYMDTKRGMYYIGPPPKKGEYFHEAYPSSGITLGSSNSLSMPIPFSTWMKRLGARKVRSFGTGDVGTGIGMLNARFGTAKTVFPDYTGTSWTVLQSCLGPGFVVVGDAPVMKAPGALKSNQGELAIYRLPRPAFSADPMALVRYWETETTQRVYGWNHDPNTRIPQMFGPPFTTDLQSGKSLAHFRQVRDMLTGGGGFWAEYDELQIAVDGSNVATPSYLPWTCMASDWYIHGVVSYPVAGVAPLSITDEEAVAFDWWVDRPMTNEHCLIPSAALAYALRSSTTHRTHSVYMTQQETDDIEAAAKQLESAPFVVGYQNISSGVLAKRLASWVPSDAAKALKPEKVLNADKGYKVKDFDSAWPGRREHTFVAALAEFQEVDPSDTPMVWTTNAVSAVTNAFEDVPFARLNGVTYDLSSVTAGPAFKAAVDAMDPPAESVRLLEPDEKDVISASLEALGFSEDFLNKVKIESNPLDDVTLPPYFGSSENREKDPMRFVMLKAFEDKGMLATVLDTLSLERAAAGQMLRR